MRIKFYNMSREPIGCINMVMPKLARDFIQAVKEAGTEFGAGYAKVNGNWWRI